MTLQIETSIKPNEKGTAVITITPVDEDETALVFGDLTNPQWQLMDEVTEAVVNSRTFAASSMSSLEVVLTGDDLAILRSSDVGARRFSFQAQYDSDAGSDLYLTAELKFSISKLIGQEDVA